MPGMRNTMNFSFMMEYEFTDEKMKEVYQQIADLLEQAENFYWKQPRECGMTLRDAAERICYFYNEHYEVGFPDGTTLEQFLCYTESEAHNAMVSHFLSSVRKEQRDRLNRLRVIGDDCILGVDGPDRGMRYEDRMAQNAGKMLDTMMEVIKEMCRKLNGRTDVEDCWVYEDRLPGYSETEERFPEDKKEEKEKKSFFAKLFSTKSEKRD